MRHDVSTAAQRDEIRQLMTDASDVTQRSQEFAERFQCESERVQREFELADSQLTQRFDAEHAELDAEYIDRLESARLAFEERVEQLNNVRNRKSDEASRRRADEIAAAKADHETTHLQLNESLQNDIATTHEQSKKSIVKCRKLRAELEDLIDAVQAHLDKRNLSLQPVKPTARKTKDWSSTCVKRFHAAETQATAELLAMQRWPLSRLLDGIWAISVPIICGIAIAYPVGRMLDFEKITWIPAVLIGTIGLTFAFRFAAQRIVTAQTRRAMASLHSQLVDAETALVQAIAAAKQEAKAALAELQNQFKLQVEATDDDTHRRILHAESDFENIRHELESVYQQQYQALEQAWERDTQQIRNHYTPRIESCNSHYLKQRDALRHDVEQRRARLGEEYDHQTEQLLANWRDRLKHFASFQETADNLATVQRQAWHDNDQDLWMPPEQPPQVVPLGSYHLDLSDRMPPIGETASDWTLPATLSFPNSASLLIKALGEGRAAAIDVLQNAMLRLLESIPAGKVRFTIFDPTGLGQNFSAFMHLADYDERLVGSRIWTEGVHIQQRLADLTEHMENVIQKYLRNEFQSIQQYNEHAGEVAEPFRVLVIANFPTHFSEEATRRLISIANSGARCGVYTLISVDLSLPLPRHIDLEDLQTHANCLIWDEGRFRWEDETLAKLPLELDLPLDSQAMTPIIKAIGRQAEDSNRVEVPFASVAPEPDEWWRGDCADELKIPLGRAGATQQLTMKLGRGTSQHVLISGKTGSGKSTLLHALVTNAAMIYPPDQLQFYLIDFKKGVEFKPYADLRLPHARVVAIESDREFGLSVLQRLDQELRKRGDQFRAAGVQSLSAFRETKLDQPMPRILLIVDEFQEFFVADDKVAHEASLLLDRLVRQGRAFGMHLVLGSQTLAGAYSLARSTIGQMAVRVALQCSASDAHLILSEDNTAARLLGRPGEAIYNDANGLLEGNHPFQVVWLPDSERSAYLHQIRELAASRAASYKPAIVFEGHAAADLAENIDLQRRLELGASDESSIAGRGWLGAAVAIKEPTAAIFRTQAGTNLLVVGQNQELATGMLTSCLVSLAAARPMRQKSPQQRSVRFRVLDGEHDNPTSGRLMDRIQPALPLDIDFHGPRTAAETVSSLVETVRERREQADQRFEPVYLFIFDLARFRDLKPAAEDFGFSSFGEQKATNPAGQLAEILRDGPAVGVHAWVWADSYNNVTRWFERSLLRDFAYRVLFQMSAVDSSNLMDSAAASHLGQFRALFYDDDRGECEKFRPYGPPSANYLTQVARKLAGHDLSTPDDDQGPAASETGTLV